MAHSGPGIAALALLSACAHQPAQPSAQPVSTAPVASPVAVAEVPLTTFGELVQSAARRDGESEQSPCLMARAASGYRLAGEVMGGVRPLPQPATDLDALLARTITVNLLTAYGRYGAAPSPLTLAGFTYAPPTRRAAAIIVTDRGAYVRGVSASLSPHDGVSLSAAATAVASLDATTVFVAAEADVSLTTVQELLALLAPHGLPVVLAVNLAAETSLPAPPESPLGTLCESGLSATTDAEGDLTAQALAAPISELRARAADCLNNANANGAAGGRMSLAMRVDRSGQVVEACIHTDETGDALLRACVVAESLKLSFPTPSPSGSVDLELPLSLRTQHPPAPSPLCQQ